MRLRTSHLLLASAVAATAALAQGRGNFKAVQAFRQAHQYTFQLRTMLTAGLTDCEHSPATQIKPPQAKRLLGILTPLTRKERLSQDEAKDAIRKVQAVLQERQLSVVDHAVGRADRRMGGHKGGARGGGSGGPSGGGGFGGGGGGFGGGGGGFRRGHGGGDMLRIDPARMQGFNPFNPKKEWPSYDQEKEKNERLFAFLKGRAAGKGAGAAGR